MSETRFTPGPWTNSGTDTVIPDCINVEGPNGEYIAGINEVAPGTDDHGDGRTFDYPGCGGDPIANANLIAAAPDLYAACQRILAHIDDVKSDDDLMECRRLLASALTKANPPAIPRVEITK